MAPMYPLDPAPEDMRAMGREVLEYLIGFIGGLDDAPAELTEGGLELARRLRASPPEQGGGFETLFAEAREAIAHTFEYSGPGYLAYIPGGGLFTAALAEFLAQGVNRYIGLWQTSPAVVQIEENVCRWMCDVFGFPAGSQGLLTTGGSMANLSAIVTARHARLGEDFLDGTYYVASARGAGADWLRNIQADPSVHVRVGGRQWDGRAEVVTDPLRIADYLQRQLERNPWLFGAILRSEGLPSRPSRQDLERLAPKRPMVAIRPVQRS